MSLFFLITIVFVLGYLAYHRIDRRVVVTTVGVLAIVAVVLPGLSWWLVAPILVLFVAITLLNDVELRRTKISAPLRKWFKRSLPTLSDTEQKALDAGTVWWDVELFSGRPDWSKLLRAPAPRLSAKERAFLEGPAEELCHMLDAWQTHRDLDLPPEVWAYMKKHRFFGMIIDEAYGGLGFSPLGNSAVVTKLATRDIAAAVTVMVPNSLGPAELLQQYGTTEQKQQFLTRLAKGEEIPCFALTSALAGSDAGAMPDKGVVTRRVIDGKEVLGFRLSWSKRYVTLAPVATLLGLAFRAFDPDGLLQEQPDLGITCALIPTDTPGVEIGRRHLPSGAAFMNGPTSGVDVFVPLTATIGGPGHIGHGWTMLVQSLAAGRAISLPALGVASGKVAAHSAGAYARIRKQFKMPIGYFEGVEEVLARLAGNAYRGDATRLLTLVALGLGERPSVLSAIAKCYLTESNRDAINDAMDLHGGKAIMQGPKNYLNLLYQAMPIGITVEGANILMRTMIIFGQGVIRAHPYVLREMNSARAPHSGEAVRDFDTAFFGHVMFATSNLVRTFWMGVSGARLVNAPVGGPTAHYYRQLTRMSSAFALVSDLVLITLGGNFKFREKLSGRLADVLAHLYMACAMLKRFEDTGRPDSDLPVLNWALRDSLCVMQASLINIIRNFPIAWARVPLRFIVFPFGFAYREPSDRLGKRLARILLNPGHARNRLTQGMYMADSDDGSSDLNRAFHAVHRSAAAERRLRAITREAITVANYEALTERALATGRFTDQDAELVRIAQLAVAKVIAVDDFESSELQADGAKERRTAAPDDLKLIRGIGPKLEGALNAAGIYYLAQLAEFTPEDVVRVDRQLKTRGRIERDGWVRQARALTVEAH